RPRMGAQVVSRRVLLAAPRSFCAGVDRAIDIVEKLLEQHGPPVFVRHQIVHNDHVVKRLEGLGAVFVDSEDEIPQGAICVLSAHGVAHEVKAMARSGACLMLVIGSESSSNARRLVEVAERAGATALLIDGESGLDPDLLTGHETVGLTAGASTPEELVALVLRSLASLGYDELEEVEVAREDVHFRLPREVAAT